jgi:Flp pilus assembly protein TadD
MGLSPMRIASSLFCLLVCGSILSGCASDNATSALEDAKPHKNATASSAGHNVVPTDLEGGIQEAQLARQAGRYDDAIHILSQLMLVASDDPRVVGEYGKTLVEKGRAQEAEQFLTRATELQPRDWTLYSALGVAYDEAGDQAAAGRAYEHALALRPGEPAIFNNYALSRMLASDPAMARQLIASAASAGGSSDPKIARNIALVNALALQPAPTPVPVAQLPVTTTAVASTAMASTPIVSTPVASAPIPEIASRAPAAPVPQVVMQAVPADPLAGPVKSHPKPAAKPVTPDDQGIKPAAAKSTGAQPIPELRQAALNY